VGVVSGSLYRRTHSLVVWLGLESAAAWHRSTFIKWTGWTLVMALPWWQHHKHDDDDDRQDDDDSIFAVQRTSAILNVLNLELVSCDVNRHADLFPCAKFHWNRTIGCWAVMAIKRFLKWRPSAIFHFFKFWYLVIWLSSSSKSAVVY